MSLGTSFKGSKARHTRSSWSGVIGVPNVTPTPKMQRYVLLAHTAEIEKVYQNSGQQYF